MNPLLYNVIIIGSGPAALTAALYVARANLNPLVIEGRNPGGQLMGTTYVENWPGTRRIMGPELMKNLRDHAQELGTEFLSDEITKADLKQQPFKVTTSKGQELSCRSMIIASGAVSRKLGCPGEDTYWGKGVTTCAVCDGIFYRDKRVIIVGGGDTAMENAHFMTAFTNHITIVHLLDKLTASHAMQQRIMNNPAIKVIYNSTITSIEGDGNHVTHAIITNQQTKEVTKVEVDGIFVSIGLTPKTELFKGQLTLNEQGYIALPDRTIQTATSIAGVFAAGDVADMRYRQAITSAGTGCMAAIDAERYLSQQP